ncbi:pilus assembly protein [Neisseria sp. Ec49-e6-T10]|uniref:pilus assembly protein n=1 Tax=Neisseria sp. Ec49-e6-T10 TaxID=3140744 RepID=UPI003EC14601
MKKMYSPHKLSTITLSFLIGFTHASDPPVSSDTFTPVPSDIIARQNIVKAKDNVLIVMDDTRKMNKTRFTAMVGGVRIALYNQWFYPTLYSDFNVGWSTYTRDRINTVIRERPIYDIDNSLKQKPNTIEEYNTQMRTLGRRYIDGFNPITNPGMSMMLPTKWSDLAVKEDASGHDFYTNLTNHYYPMLAKNMKYRCAQNHLIIVSATAPDAKPTSGQLGPEQAAKKSTWTSVFENGGNKYDQDKPPGKFNEDGWPKQIIHTHILMIGHDGTSWGFKTASEGKGRFVVENGSSREEIAKAVTKLLTSLARESLPTLAVNPGFSHATTSDSSTLSFQVYRNHDIWASQVKAVELKNSGSDIKEDTVNGTPNTYHQAYSWEKNPKTSYSIVTNTPKDGIQSLNYGDLGKQLDNNSFDLKETNKDQWKNNFVPWLAFWQAEQYIDGKDDDSIGKPGTGYRVRDTLGKGYGQSDSYDRFIGDMLTGNILFSGPANEFKYRSLSSTTAKTTQLNEFMFLSSNDGMTKIYQNQSSSGDNPYAFVFGYIPGAAKRENGQSLIQDIKDRANPDYTKDSMHPHIYLSNGDTRQMTSPRGHNVIVTTIGQGGKGAFALNVGGNTDWNKTEKVGVNAAQDNTQLKDTVPLWDTAAKIEGGVGVGVSDTENIGYTVGAPAVDIVALNRTENKKPVILGDDADVRMAAFIANGAESSEATPTLYIIDTIGAKMHKKGSVNNNSKGKLIAKLSANPVLGNKNSALSTPIPVDLDGDDIADLVYAGDRNGDLYRFDLRGTSPEKWTAQLLFKGSLEQPISSAPSVHVLDKGKKLMVVFGTGSDLYTKDSQDTNEQALYGIIDDVSADITIPVTQDNLQKQTLSITDIKYRTVSPKKLSEEELKNKQKGWFIPLNKTGEKIINDVDVRNGTVYANTVIFRPKKQSDDPLPETRCSTSTANADSWLLMVKAENGGLADKQVSGMKNKDGEYIAGLYFEGSMLNSPNFLSPSLNLVTGQGFAHNENGIRTKTGQSQFGQDKVEQEKGCVKGKTYIYIPDPDNPSNRIAKQIICAASKGLTRRISWRII